MAPLGDRLQLTWDRLRPFQTPRYLPNTPAIGGTGPLDPVLPPTAQTLGAAALSSEASEAVEQMLAKLTQNNDAQAGQVWHAMGRAKYGPHWRFADQLTTLWAASTLIQPSTYLEIGVCRARSAAVVARVRPECAIYGFDLWVPDYAGGPNPGPEFVEQELDRVGYKGSLTLESGDSAMTLPAYLDRHPDLFFDLITIDGAKTLDAVAADYANALPRLKVGGIVVTDDLVLFPTLRRIWERVIERDARFAPWEYREANYGVAAAVRVR
jgi:predicted O-methyltransferase YrrM